MKSTGKRKVIAVEQMIRTAIFRAEYEPGDALPELHLARRMKVSQSTVREALLRLNHSGLVRRMANRGTFVTNLSPQDIAERIKIRTNLEVMAAREAANRAREQDFGELDLRLHKLTAAIAANDYSSAIVADLSFHAYIWSMSGNRLLPEILDQVSAPLMAFSGLWRSQRRENLQEVTESHQALIEALKQRDANGVEAAFRRHVEASYGRLTTLTG